MTLLAWKRRSTLPGDEGWLAASATVATTITITAILIAILVARPEIATNQTKIEERLAALSVTRQLLASAPKRQDSLRQERTAFWGGKNDGAVAAEFQNRVRTLIVGKNAQLRTLSPMPVKVSDNLRFVGVSIEYGASFQTTQDIFQTLETMRPYVFVDRVAMRLEQSPPIQPGFPAEPQAVVEIQLSGAVWSDAGGNAGQPK